MYTIHRLLSIKWWKRSNKVWRDIQIKKTTWMQQTTAVQT